jgi:hypothetical protein
MNWEPLDTGCEALKFWKAVPPQGQEPEIAVLRLSSQKYAEMKKGPKDFVNKIRLFDRPLNSLELQPEPTGPGAKNAVPLVIVVHRPNSSAYGSAVDNYEAVARAA